jgi:NAD+ kinase
LKKSVRQFKRVGLVGNLDKPASRRVIRLAARLIAASGRTSHCDAATAKFAGLKGATTKDVAALADRVDLLLVFGGDGTILRAARDIAGSPIPILGINIGGLGFLTATSARHLSAALQQVWVGKFELEPRTLIEATGRNFRHLALNDFVVTHGSQSRLVELEVRVDGETLTHYRADGLIVSSPTGSTAYSLAAGGAIVVPTARVLALTPICAHTLSNRPLILDSGSTIQIKVISARPATILSGDGQTLNELAAGDTVTLRRSRLAVRLVYLRGISFFDTLRAKLDWRGATV